VQIFFSVGEPSGDLHGANLIRALKRGHPDWTFVGYGGPKMAAAGCDLHADLTRLAVMWLLRVLANIGTFLRLVREADRYFANNRPDAVVLIDYPGFNWWIARRAKARGIPVFYYGAPQLWAWASYRVGKMRRYVDHVLCKLPFEEQWFRDRGCCATYVGHPYFDELALQTIDQAFVAESSRGGPLIAILPGSRMQEVQRNAHWFLRAAERIAAEIPSARFAVAAFRHDQAALVRRMAEERRVQVDVHVDRTPELIKAADCCLACSGSVSLELLYHCKPSVILYHVSRPAYALQGLFRRVRYITLVNLLTAERPFAGRPAGVYDPLDPRDAHVLMPEYLTCRDKSEQLADHCVDWLTNRVSRERTIAGMSQLLRQIGAGGASERAAIYIAQSLLRTGQCESGADQQAA